MRQHRLFPGTFQDLFPSDPNVHSLCQAFVFDVLDQFSPCFQPLKITANYGNPDVSVTDKNSPKLIHWLVVSVHPTGMSSVHASKAIGGSLQWQFYNINEVPNFDVTSLVAETASSAKAVSAYLTNQAR